MPPSRQPWLGERETEFPTWDNTLGPSTEDNDLSASSNSEVEFEPEPCERRERDRSVRWNDQETLAQELSNSNGRAALRIPSGRVFVGDSITQASENDWRPSFSSDGSQRTPQDFRDVFAQVLLQDQHQLDDLVVDFQDAQRCQLRKQMERLKQALAQQRARLLTILEDTLSARPDTVAFQSLSGTPRLEIPSHPSVNSIATSTKKSTSPDSTPRVARCGVACPAVFSPNLSAAMSHHALLSEGHVYNCGIVTCVSTPRHQHTSRQSTDGRTGKVHLAPRNLRALP